MSDVAYDYAVHSDFLIHWTGKDLDAKYDPTWYESDKSKITNGSALAKAYLERLRTILKFGLWLTTEPAERIHVDGEDAVVPSTPKVCFTELKLSQSRVHAKRYGRLGVGVKRKFLFDRFGRPLAYYGFRERAHNDRFLKACARDLEDPRLLNFFKPMNSGRTLNYDLYAESEWRILYFPELIRNGLLVDPHDETNQAANTFCRSLDPMAQEKLRFLAPLDGWFAMIIYPALAVKNAAQQDPSTEIRDLINRIKTRSGDHGNAVEGGNWPIELNLDACRNF